MTKRFGLGSKETYDFLHKILEGYQDPEETHTISTVMQLIQEVLDPCYMIGMNPLRELRRILPQYAWKHYESSGEEYIKRVVQTSDYIWRLDWLLSDGYTNDVEFVTATKLDRPAAERFSRFWMGDNVEFSRNKQLFLRLLESFGGKIVT